MPLEDDPTVTLEAHLLRVLYRDPNWTTIKDGRLRPTKLAFYSATQEISYFVEAPGVIAELWRIFPDHKIARIPVSVMRDQGFAIERRPQPDECPEDFRCDRTLHVIAGPAIEMGRHEYQRRARRIANHDEVTIIEPEPQQVVARS